MYKQHIFSHLPTYSNWGVISQLPTKSNCGVISLRLKAREIIDQTQVKLFSNFTRHHLIPHTNYQSALETAIFRQKTSHPMQNKMGAK